MTKENKPLRKQEWEEIRDELNRISNSIAINLDVFEIRLKRLKELNIKLRQLV